MKLWMCALLHGVFCKFKRTTLFIVMWKFWFVRSHSSGDSYCKTVKRILKRPYEPMIISIHWVTMMTEFDLSLPHGKTKKLRVPLGSLFFFVSFFFSYWIFSGPGLPSCRHWTNFYFPRIDFFFLSHSLSFLTFSPRLFLSISFRKIFDWRRISLQFWRL